MFGDGKCCVLLMSLSWTVELKASFLRGANRVAPGGVMFVKCTDG